MSVFGDRVKAKDYLLNGYVKSVKLDKSAKDDLQRLNDHLSGVITDSLSGDIEVEDNDTGHLVRLIPRYGEQFALKKILPLAKKNIRNISFTISFIRALAEAMEDKSVRAELAQDLSKDLLGDIMPELDQQLKISDRFNPSRAYPQYIGTSKRYKYGNQDWSRRDKWQITTDPELMTGEQLATLVCVSERLNLKREIEEICRTLSTQAFTVDLCLFGSFLIPLLEHLPSPPTISGSSDGKDNHYQPLFQAVLSAYVQRYVQPRTPPLRDWSRQQRGCGCDNCRVLDRFLTNPTAEFGRFPMNGPIRTHLEQQLRGSYCETTTERHGSPHTLVVRKINKEWHQKMAKWEQRWAVAANKMKGIGDKKLVNLLGDQYQAIVHFDNQNQADVAGRPPSASNENQNGPQSISHTNAKPVIIDLSEE